MTKSKVEIASGGVLYGNLLYLERAEWVVGQKYGVQYSAVSC